jgi:hypothetical protein
MRVGRLQKNIAAPLLKKPVAMRVLTARAGWFLEKHQTKVWGGVGV